MYGCPYSQSVIINYYFLKLMLLLTKPADWLKVYNILLWKEQQKILLLREKQFLKNILDLFTPHNGCSLKKNVECLELENGFFMTSYRCITFKISFWWIIGVVYLSGDNLHFLPFLAYKLLEKFKFIVISIHTDIYVISKINWKLTRHFWVTFQVESSCPIRF